MDADTVHAAASMLGYWKLVSLGTFFARKNMKNKESDGNSLTDFWIRDHRI